MTYLKPISGSKSRLDLLKYVQIRLQEELASGRFGWLDPRLAELPNLIERLDSAFIGLKTVARQRRQVIKGRREQVRVLYEMLTHFQLSIQKQSAWLPNGALLLDLYPFEGKGLSAYRNNHGALLDLARTLAQAEAKAIEAGFEPNGSPTLAQVQALSSAQATQFTAADQAHHAQKQAQAALREVQAEVSAFLKILLSYLRSVTVSYPKKAQRDILRTFGFRFKTDSAQESEPTEEDTDETTDEPTDESTDEPTAEPTNEPIKQSTTKKTKTKGKATAASKTMSSSVVQPQNTATVPSAEEAQSTTTAKCTAVA